MDAAVAHEPTSAPAHYSPEAPGKHCLTQLCMDGRACVEVLVSRGKVTAPF